LVKEGGGEKNTLVRLAMKKRVIMSQAAGHRQLSIYDHRCKKFKREKTIIRVEQARK